MDTLRDTLSLRKLQGFISDDNILNLWNFTYVGKLSCITVDIIISKILLRHSHKKYSKSYCFSKHYLEIEKRACILKIIQHNAQEINLP